MTSANSVVREGQAPAEPVRLGLVEKPEDWPYQGEIHELRWDSAHIAARQEPRAPESNVWPNRFGSCALRQDLLEFQVIKAKHLPRDGLRVDANDFDGQPVYTLFEIECSQFK